MGMKYIIVALASAIMLKQPCDADCVAARYNTRILRYDPNIDQEMADEIRSQMNTEWTQKYLAAQATDKWDPRKDWNPDNVNVSHIKALKIVDKYAADEKKRYESFDIDPAL